MMSSNKNSFSASDIERYHSGNMSAEERHALEKAALDDPFLADALEGYAFTATPQADLQKIKARLQENTAKRAVPFYKSHRWLSVAALLLLMGGVGWFVYKASSNKAPSLAAQKKAVDKQLQTTPSVATDSVVTMNTKPNNPSPVDMQTSLPKKSGQAEGRKEPPLLNKEVLNEVVIPKKQMPSLSLTDSANNDVVLAEPKKETGNGYLSRNAERSLPRVNKNAFVNNNDTYQQQASNDTIKNLNIVLKPLPFDQKDSVLIAKGKSKKSTDRYHVIIDTLEPAEGYTNFDDYIAANLQVPDEIKDKPTAGEVQLSFDVDENGHATNITVLKSLCDKCDEEAIRLLKEGPRWKKKKNKKGKVTIKF